MIAWVDEAKHRKLKATAAQLGKTMNEAVDEAIDAWLIENLKGNRRR